MLRRPIRVFLSDAIQSVRVFAGIAGLQPMRYSTAHFHLLPLANVPAVEIAALRERRAWFGGAPIDEALRMNSGDVREFAGEGLMTTWMLHYLHERGAIPAPGSYFQAPLAQRVAAGLRTHGRRQTRAVVTFDATECAGLVRAMSGISPTEAELVSYWKGWLDEALGVEAAERRMREDASVPQLVQACHDAFGWLLECVGRVGVDTLGLLVVRDAPRPRWRWLTHRRTGPGRKTGTGAIFVARDERR